MDSRMWLLVDWVDEGNAPVYGIVNIDIMAYDGTEMIPGNVIFIRTRHSAPRRAKIVRVSERRKNIEKQKALLERQERQVNDVLQRCMQTINEIRSEDSYYPPNQLSRPPTQRAARTSLMVVGRIDNSESDRCFSESNFMGAARNSRNFSRLTPTFNSRHNRMPSMGTQFRNALTDTQLHDALPENSSERRSIICSTPLPSSSSQQVTNLTINQATQTEMSFGPIVERIEMLEETAHKLYEQLLIMMSQATMNPSTSDLDHNNEGIMVRPNSIEFMQQSSGSSLAPGFVEEIFTEEEMESSNNGGSLGVDQEQHNSSNYSNSNIGEDQKQHNSSNVSNCNIGVDQEPRNSSYYSNSNIGEDQEPHNSPNYFNSNIGEDQEQHNSSNYSNSNIAVDQEPRNSSYYSNSNIGEDQEPHNSSNYSNSNIGEDQEPHNSSNVSNSIIGVDQELHNSSNDSNSNILRVRSVSPQTSNNIEPVPDGDLVLPGNSHGAVPRRLLNNIDWTSYTSATRQLLQAIFPRRVLATHSLSGKQSPAFSNRPAKRILHPEIVEDIVTTVSTRCCVPKKFVRKVITAKCSDEAKLYRIRERRTPLRQPRNNEENLRPSTSSSD